MSARAAWRLESLGFEQVYRYTAGKVDWMAAGLPIEGTKGGLARVGDLARRDVPTCGPGERLGAIRDRVLTADRDGCVVVNKRKIVLGRLTRAALDGDADTTAEQVMEPGPVTYRPHQDAAEAARTLTERRVESVLVTTGDGELIGVFRGELSGCRCA